MPSVAAMTNKLFLEIPALLELDYAFGCIAASSACWSDQERHPLLHDVSLASESLLLVLTLYCTSGFELRVWLLAMPHFLNLLQDTSHQLLCASLVLLCFHVLYGAW